ncbi:MAG: hypothetical protein LBC80_09250 [Treponema sp.]|jgi:hypothetical protein|nr:hypothetical protein [Treponema sp.]
MKKSIVIYLLLIAAVLISVSCKSTPAPEQQELASGLVGENELIAKVQAARQRAIDFESPVYFPSEWETIEAQFEAARNTPGTSAETFDEVAAAYDEIFGKTIPLYAQAREDEIMLARKTLIDSGFTQEFPEFLKNIDDIALLAMEQYEAEDYYTARETATKALSEYETLLLGARVFLVRQEVITRGFNDYDGENFIKAEEVACEALEEFGTDNIEAAITKAEEALLRFNLVLANGWPAYASDRQAYAENERELALAERANIASRELFREADAVFEQAGADHALENFHDAALHFIDAEALFAIARLDTGERRQRAEAAILAAEERIEESNETALEAERIIEGGIR